MLATDEKLSVAVHASALVAGDVRPLAIARAMEQVLPGLRLEWEVSQEGVPLHVENRDAWLLAGTPDGGFPLVCNGDELHPVTLHGLASSPRSSVNGTSGLNIHSKLPLDEVVRAHSASLLEHVAEAAHGRWGHATPWRSLVEILEQMARPVLGPHIPPRGLPILQLSKDLRSPEVPHHLGWINYWSAATARLLGFPDATLDSEWLPRARRTQSGGWLLQLTDAPLNLDDPAHLATLLRAYERFREIGGRAPA
ncbi:DUF5953 family protein [Corallococcus terminator]